MADLSTNYMDDILAESMNGKRKYRITRADGSFEEVTLEDISEYEQRGSVFGAGDINRTNQAVNEKFDSGDVVDPMEATEEGFAADAYQTKLQFDEQNKNLGNKELLPYPNSTFAYNIQQLNANLEDLLNNRAYAYLINFQGTSSKKVPLLNGDYRIEAYLTISDATYWKRTVQFIDGSTVKHSFEATMYGETGPYIGSLSLTKNNFSVKVATESNANKATQMLVIFRKVITIN